MTLGDVENAWDLWEHINGVVNKNNNISHEYNNHQLNLKIHTLYSGQEKDSLPREDCYLLDLPLRVLLSKDVEYKKEWTRQIIIALQCIRQRVGATIQSQQELRDRHNRQLRGMQRRLRGTLHSNSGVS
jgi:hypothetical protein